MATFNDLMWRMFLFFVFPNLFDMPVQHVLENAHLPDEEEVEEDEEEWGEKRKKKKRKKEVFPIMLRKRERHLVLCFCIPKKEK